MLALKVSLLISWWIVFKRHLCWDKKFGVWTSPLNSNKELAVLLVTLYVLQSAVHSSVQLWPNGRKIHIWRTGDMLLILVTSNNLVLVLVLVPVPVLDNSRIQMRFFRCSSVCVRQKVYFLNARLSRTLLTAAIEGAIIPTVGRVSHSWRYVA